MHDLSLHHNGDTVTGRTKMTGSSDLKAVIFFPDNGLGKLNTIGLWGRLGMSSNVIIAIVK